MKILTIATLEMSRISVFVAYVIGNAFAMKQRPDVVIKCAIRYLVHLTMNGSKVYRKLGITAYRLVYTKIFKLESILKNKHKSYINKYEVFMGIIYVHSSKIGYKIVKQLPVMMFQENRRIIAFIEQKKQEILNRDNVIRDSMADSALFYALESKFILSFFFLSLLYLTLFLQIQVLLFLLIFPLAVRDAYNVSVFCVEIIHCTCKIKITFNEQYGSNSK